MTKEELMAINERHDDQPSITVDNNSFDFINTVFTLFSVVWFILAVLSFFISSSMLPSSTDACMVGTLCAIFVRLRTV